MEKVQQEESDAARSAAVRLLQAVLGRAQTLEQAADGALSGLHGRDRGFAMLLAKTVLRRLGQIDGMLQTLLQSPLPANRGDVQQVLRLGMTQLMYLGTPPHAAVHTAVEMVKKRHPNMAGLVNAVLNRAFREKEPLLAAFDDSIINFAEWLRDDLLRAYGKQVTAAIAEVLLQEPPLDVTLKYPDETKKWADALEGVCLVDGSVRLSGNPDVTQLPGFAEGAWWVQDMAASLPVHLLGDVKGKRLLDICAAPGGKTMQLAAKGAQVTALDISANRTKLLQANLERTQMNAEIVVTDALKYTPNQPFDAILLDAPCSATGTLRRHPEVSRHRTPEDIRRLVNIQERLIQHALTLLKPRGVLVYAVCSLQQEEGDAQIDKLLAKRKDIALDPMDADAAELSMCVTKEGYLRTLPCHFADHGGMDGFFAARLVKKD